MNSDHKAASERLDVFQARDMELNDASISSLGKDAAYNMSPGKSSETDAISNKQHLQLSSRPGGAYSDQDMENNNSPQVHCCYEPTEQTTSTREDNMDNLLLTTSIADSMNTSVEIHEKTDITSTTGTPLSRSVNKENLHRPDLEGRPSSSQEVTPALSQKKYAVIPRTVPPKISESNRASKRSTLNQNQPGLPLTVSRLVTSSASVLVDSTEEKWTEGEMANNLGTSVVFGSSLSIQALGKIKNNQCIWWKKFILV